MVWVPCVREILVPYLMRTLWILVSPLYVISILAFSLLSIVSCSGQKTLVLTYLFAFTFAATLFSETKTYCSLQCQKTSFPCPDFSLNTSTHSNFVVLSILPQFRFTLRGNHILYSNCSNIIQWLLRVLCPPCLHKLHNFLGRWLSTPTSSRFFPPLSFCSIFFLFSFDWCLRPRSDCTLWKKLPWKPLV